ncbi:MAG TPA: hypothetical protein VFQ44_06545, partial [Streptosporangiaceae bacterium]|nr:hypothetical protein [Streptosporangiaceae bacterium]
DSSAGATLPPWQQERGDVAVAGGVPAAAQARRCRRAAAAGQRSPQAAVAAPGGLAAHCGRGRRARVAGTDGGRGRRARMAGADGGGCRPPGGNWRRPEARAQRRRLPLPAS